MTTGKHAVTIMLMCVMAVACATRGDMMRLEEKLDRIMVDVDRSTLDEIFGSQSAQVTERIEKLDEDQVKRFAEIRESYEKGMLSLEEVREQMLSLLGGNDREVVTPAGVYVRDMEGRKLRAVPNGTRLMACKLLAVREIPEAMTKRNDLQRYSWGVGSIKEVRVIFPWDFTLSTFAKEVAEVTALRTAQEFERLGGEKGWNRPIYIEVSPENSGRITLTTTEQETEISVIQKEGIRD